MNEYSCNHLSMARFDIANMQKRYEVRDYTKMLDYLLMIDKWISHKNFKIFTIILEIFTLLVYLV